MQDFWDPIKPKAATLLTDAVGESITGAAVTGFGSHERLQATLQVVSCAGGAAGDKLDVYLDRGNGTLWVNAAHFTQVLGSAAAKRFTAVLDHVVTTPGATTTDVSDDCASGVVRPAVQGDQLRARAVVTKVAGTLPWTYSVTAVGE